MDKAKIEEAEQFLNQMSSKGADGMRPFIGKDGKPYILQHRGGSRDDLKNYERKLVVNATLRYDEWRALDAAVLKVAEQRLVGFEDLKRNGLVHPLSNAMAKTVLTYQGMSDGLEAGISIDPIKRTQGDRVQFETKHIPLPVIHSDYQIPERILLESRNIGNGLDTLNAERAARKVAQKLEDMLFGSTSSFTYGGGVIYTYLTHPDINTVSFASSGEYWDDSGVDGPDIKTNVLEMKQASINDNYFGPWMLYIPTDYETIMDDDYDVSGASLKTIRERILEIGGIQGIKVVDRLADDTVILVTMQSDVVDYIDGMPMQNVQWDTEGGFMHNYKVMTIQIPRVKSDYNDASGVVVLS